MVKLGIKRVALLGISTMCLVVAGPAAAFAQPAPIGVVGTVDGVVTVTGTASFPDILLALSSAQVPVSPTAEVGAFIGPAGEVVPATAGIPEFRGLNGTVRITAQLPFGGPYTAELRLGHDGMVDPPLKVSVTRTQAPAPVIVDGVATLSTESDGFGRTSVVRRLTLTETAGRPLALQAPTVVTASQSAASQTLLADVRVMSFNTEASATICSIVDRKISIQAAQTCPVVLTLELPAAPATYNATVRFGAGGYNSIDDKLTIQTRRNWLVALLVFILGVGLGALVVQVIRPAQERLQIRITVARIRQELDGVVRRLGATDDQEQRLVDGLYALVGALDDTADHDPAAAADYVPVVRTQVGQLRTWVGLHRALLAADPAVRDALTPALDDLADDMQLVTSDAAVAERLPKGLQELRTRLDELTLQQVKARAQRLREESRRLGLRPPEADELTAALDTAEAAATTQEAARALTTAQDIAVRAMAARMTGIVAQDATTLQLPVEAARWEELRHRVAGHIHEAETASGEERIQRLRRADVTLVSGMATAVLEKLRPRRDGWAASRAPKLRELAAALDPVIAALDRAHTEALAGNVAEAHSAYDAAVAAWAAWAAAAKAAGEAAHLGPAAGEALPALASVSVETVPQPTYVPPPGPRSPTLRELRRGQKVLRVALVIVACLVALLAGLATLYVGDPTWGGPEDVIAALLWGLGLTAAGTAAGFAGAYTAVTR